MENELPKVLVVSTNAWKDNTGINTLIEFFRCWNPERLAQIYTRSALPNTTVCDSFFQISENAVMKSVFHRNIKTGRIVDNKNFKGMNKEEEEAEINMYSHNGVIKRRFLSLCRELVWKFGKWKSKELDSFIDNFDPDILYIPIYPTIYMGRIQKYIIQYSKKPVVCYLADDNYTFRSVSKNPISLIERAILRKYVRFIVRKSSKLMVIVPKQKEVYDRIFGTDSVVLTKGIDFRDYPFVNKPISTPIKMVYTGKLIYGRWKSLVAITEALGKINKNEIKVEFDIYTTDQLNQKQNKLLNRNGCKVKGAVPLDRVKEIQRIADILVFVESMEKKYKYTAWLSFSTKITDYMRSGKCIFAIGDKEIGPMDYFERYNSAVTATSYEEISINLKKLISDKNMIFEMAKSAYECGVEHHSLDKMNNVLKSAIIDTVTEFGDTKL